MIWKISIGCLDYQGMVTRGSQTITWDAENRPVTVSENGTAITFVYDGDGNRVKKFENGQTILYINKYFEVNCASSAFMALTCPQ